MAGKKIDVSIVIPTYNEEQRIEGSLLKIKEFMDKQDYKYEIIVSDDGSNDKTKKNVEKIQKKWPQLRLIANKHKGKAPTVITGINSSLGEYVFFTDADLSVSIEELPKFMVWLKDNDYDIAIATREGLGAKRINEPYTRHFMGRVFNLIVQVMVLPGVNDTQCGFKGFKTAKAKEIFKYTKIYSADDLEIQGGRLGAYDVEILYIAKRLGYNVKEVPVTWIYGDNSKIHKFSDSYNNLLDVFKVRLNSLKGLYP